MPAALSPLLPSVALPCSPQFSFDRPTPMAQTSAPANTIFRLVGPLAPSSRVEVAPLGQAATAAVTVNIVDSSLWSLSNVPQVTLPPAGTATAVRVSVYDGFSQIAEHFDIPPTGAPDTTPPQLAGDLSMSYVARSGLPNGGCVRQDHFEVRITFPAATDDDQVANYTMYETTGGQMRALSSMGAIQGPRTPGSYNIVSPVARTPGRRCFAVLARDLAGNESPPIETCEEFVAPPALDAGPAPTPDAGPALDAGPSVLDAGPSVLDAATGAPSATTGGQGCTCASPSNRGASASLGLLLVLFGGLWPIFGRAKRRP